MLALPVAAPAGDSPAVGEQGKDGSEARTSEAGAAATRRVRVIDTVYSPRRLRVARGTLIRWVWSRRNTETHDVYLNKKPKGVKHFHSKPATTSYSYKRRLRKPGVYKVLCTFHEGMAMRIRVKR
jgi:plastocyanin